MGHYLGEMESDEEYDRRLYEPLRKKLEVYDEEVKRGLAHTSDYNIEMTKLRHRLKEKGYDV